MLDIIHEIEKLLDEMLARIDKMDYKITKIEEKLR